MSKLILPNSNGAHRSTKRSSDFITINEAKEMMIGLYGPLASLVKEMAIRLQMDGVEPTPTDQPTMPSSGDIE